MGAGRNVFELVLNVADGAADFFQGFVGVFGAGVGNRLLGFDLFEVGGDGVEALEDALVLFTGDVLGHVGRALSGLGADGEGAASEEQKCTNSREESAY